MLVKELPLIKMIASYKKLIKSLNENRILYNEKLNKYSSFKVGGCADIYYKCNSKDELIEAVVASKKYSIPYIVIGGGTNLLISDNGFKGLVIKNESKEIKIVGIRGVKNHISGFRPKNQFTVFLEVDSGVTINRLVRFTLDQGLKGIEAFLGQPGSVGGAVWINAHNLRMLKYVSDAIESIKIINKYNKLIEVPKSYFQFSYDNSIIQSTKEIVVSVIFKFQRSNSEDLWKVANQSLIYRKESQPTGIYSSGCTFRNISKVDAIRLTTPEYTCSAGYIIESLGLKGKSIGGAKFSNKHANFIVHNGNANSRDIYSLIQLAKKRAKSELSIDLKEEIVLVGEF